ncbi:MAG: hypothetical protein M3N12_07615 [Verrucomicrobiota bacterium]|nr:hypothetical protein [Verrucomicrobiota bacterium]
MRRRKFIILLASLLFTLVLLLCLAPLIVAGGLRVWAARIGRREGLSIELGKISAPLLRPVAVEKVRIVSQPGAPFRVAIETSRVELDLNLAALFSSARGRVLHSITVDAVSIDLRQKTEPASGSPQFAWRFVEDLLADNFKISGAQLHVENGETMVDLQNGTLSGAQIEAGIFTAEKLTVNSRWLRKTFSSLRGATSWQENRLTLGALTLSRGLDLDAISIDLSHIGESRIDLEMTLDAFGGKLRARVSSDDRGDRRTWDVAGSASEISLTQMSEALDWQDRARGSLHASRFTFRGEATNLGEATASVWAEVTGLTWRDRTADTIMVGASLSNREVQIEQLYVKQRNNQLTLTGEFALPQHWADLLRPDFRGDVSASIDDLGDFARLFGASPSDFAGRVAINGRVNALDRKLGGALEVSGNALVLFRAPVESLNAKLTFKDSRLEIERLELKQKNDSFQGKASIDLAGERQYSGSFNSSISEIAQYAGFLPASLAESRFGGSLELNWTGSGNNTAHSGTFRARARALHPQSSALVPFDAEFEGDYASENIFFRQFHLSNPHSDFSAFATVAKDYFQLQTLRLDLNGKPKLQGNVFVPMSLWKLLARSGWLAALGEDPNFDLDVTLDSIDLAELADAVTTHPNMSGQAAGKIELYGTPASLDGKSDFHLHDLSWETARRISADLDAGLAAGTLSVKANVTAATSDPVTLDGAIPLRLEKRESGYGLNTEGPISATLSFPAVLLGKLPRFVTGGVFRDGIVSGRLNISDSLGRPRILGEVHLIDGKFGVGNSLSSQVTFAGQAATIEFVQLKQNGVPFFARGEIDFENLNAIALKVFPSARLLDSSGLERGDCVRDLTFSTSSPKPFSLQSVQRIDFRGSLFAPPWTISLTQDLAAEADAPASAPRTFSFCPDDRSHGKTLTLRAAPASFP